MSKNRTRFYVILVILLILVSAIAFAIPMVKTPVFWLSYAFAVVAITIQAYSWPKAFGGHGARSKFYGFPIARITTIYLVIQLVLSTTAMLLSETAQAEIPTWATAVVYTVLLGLTLIGLITAEGMREEAERQEAAKPVKTENMRQLRSMAEALAASCEDPELKSALNELAEEFRYSDPVSGEATEKLEMRLDVMLDELRQSAAPGQIERTRQVLEERNRLCRQTKNNPGR